MLASKSSSRLRKPEAVGRVPAASAASRKAPFAAPTLATSAWTDSSIFSGDILRWPRSRSTAATSWSFFSPILLRCACVARVEEMAASLAMSSSADCARPISLFAAGSAAAAPSWRAPPSPPPASPKTAPSPAPAISFSAVSCESPRAASDTVLPAPKSAPVTPPPSASAPTRPSREVAPTALLAAPPTALRGDATIPMASPTPVASWFSSRSRPTSFFISCAVGSLNPVLSAPDASPTAAPNRPPVTPSTAPKAPATTDSPASSSNDFGSTGVLSGCL